MDDQIDIDEISNHVKELLNNNDVKTKKVENFENLPTWKEVPREELFEVEKIDKQNFSVMSDMNDINLHSRICDLCNKTMSLEENLSGLVIDDSHFLCEECCQESSNEELSIWTTSKKANPGDLKPIALWLMKEKNKTTLFNE